MEWWQKIQIAQTSDRTLPVRKKEKKNDVRNIVCLQCLLVSRLHRMQDDDNNNVILVSYREKKKPNDLHNDKINIYIALNRDDI